MTQGGSSTPRGDEAGLAAAVWIAIAAGAIVLIVLIVLVATSGDDDVAATTTTTTEAETTTTEEETTTTAEETTTTAEETTTTAEETTTTAEETTTTDTVPPGREVTPTPVVALLGIDPPPYGDGAALFPPGSVEANWYQWEGFYVVLYRGLNLDDTGPLCPGNSIDTGTFENVSNSPIPLDLGDPCTGATEEELAQPPAGARQCGSLVYYVTEIPTDKTGDLFGTVEVWRGGGVFDGQTSKAATDLANTPEFVPDASGYLLPASGVDDAHAVECPGG